MSNNYGVQPGFLKEFLSRSTHDRWKGKPLRVQVTNLKALNDNNPAERRYRCIFSDGVYSAQGLLDSNLNSYLDANGFARFSILTLKHYTLGKTTKRIIVVSDLTVDVPKAEKFGKELSTLDSFFDQHPEEDMCAFASAALIATDRQESVPSGTPSYAPAPQRGGYGQPAPQRAKPSAPERHVNPIESLSPYQNNWTIKGRVSYKGDIRTWSNAKGEGKLFNVNFLDESDEIRATAFNETAEKFFNLLEEGKVYYVTKARIQQAKPKFSHLNHPYELSLDKDTEITECFDTSDVPKISFNFCKLDRVQDLDVKSVVDVIGVVKEVNDLFQITAKSTGKPFDRRNITIVDDTNFAIEVGLWNATAVDFKIPTGSVAAFKGVKASDFGGRSLTLTHSGSIVSNPDIPEAYQLKGWYDNQGVSETFKSLKVESAGSSDKLDQRKTIQAAENEGLGGGEKPDYFSMKATINYIKPENFCYPACNNEVDNNMGRGPSPCNRKVVSQSDGSWRCERCDLNFPEPHYRYILSASVVDHSAQIWVTMFDEEAKNLLKVTAGELMSLKEEEDGSEFTKVINSVTMREFNFRVKAKQDSYNGNIKTRYQVASLSMINFEAECAELVRQLEGVSVK